MIEILASYITHTDILVVICVVAVCSLWQIASTCLKPVQISITKNDRLFTVIQNKWQGSKYNRYVYKPTWFIHIEAIMNKKPDASRRPGGQFINPLQSTEPGTYPIRKSVTDTPQFPDFPASNQEKINHLSQLIEDFDPHDLPHKMMQDDLEAELQKMLDAKNNQESEGILHNDGEINEEELSEGAPNMISHRSKLVSSKKGEGADAKNPTGANVRKYRLKFYIPFYIDRQFNNFVNFLCRVHLSDEQKEEIFQQMYWNAEEHKYHM
jgi:hypothetical protein